MAAAVREPICHDAARPCRAVGSLITDSGRTLAAPRPDGGRSPALDTVPPVPDSLDSHDSRAPRADRQGQGDHYFTQEPASADERRLLDVTLAGRPVRAWTAPGIFSPGRVDLGTQVLLREVPPPATRGDLLDLGCGWGPLALTMALASPEARVWAVDVNRRSLDLVARTAADLGLRNLTGAEPDAVPDAVTFSTIWSNPPIRVGKPALHALLAHWLPRLAPDGAAYLVVQRNLGADSLHRWLVEELGLPTERVGSAKGFRVLRVSPPAQP